MSNLVLTGGEISPGIKRTLDLPPDTWQLVFNRGFTIASYMDGKCRVHHLDIDDFRRQSLQTMIRQ